MESSPVVYPRLIRRVQALLIDGLLVPLSAMTVLLRISALGGSGRSAAISALLTIFVLEPLLVSLSGGTIGHHLRGLRVVDPRSGGRIGILRACIRFMLKTLFGWLSLISFFITRRYQALHDLASRSVVVLNNPSSMERYDKLAERRFRREGYRYPPWYWQMLVVVSYNLIFVFASHFTIAGFERFACDRLVDYCGPLGFVLRSLWEIALLLFVGGSIYFCRSGRLWGCRGKPLV